MKIKKILLAPFKIIWGIVIKPFIEIISLPFKIPFLFEKDMSSGLMLVKREQIEPIAGCKDKIIQKEFDDKGRITLEDLWLLMFVTEPKNVYYYIRNWLGLLAGMVVFGYLICVVILSIRSKFFQMIQEQP